MKKLSTLLFICLTIVVNAQTITRTVLSNKDTLRATTTQVITYVTKYDTLKYRPYLTSRAVAYSNQNNFTISGLSFDSAAILVSLQGCTNVHITKCRFSNAGTYAIKIYGGCTNVTVDSCFFTNIAFGVYAQQSKVIKIVSNQCLNLKGSGTLKAHFAQLDNVNSGGNQINNNRIENIAGIAVNPHDIISLYQSNGLPGDSIQVIGNWIRGGQIKFLTADKSDGATGIGLCDGFGSYQVCRGNILVNPGYVGIQPVGTGNAIKIDHNIIYSSQTPVSLVGISYQLVGSGYVGYNKINWTSSNGTSFDQWTKYAAPNGWGTNILRANISASILPTVIIK